ncbi:uncharacterized protein LOC112462831 [Temnothorax curvispinosus]|uniref:Uncharacterized protein LOC112462831 n=1 Tax=Temnothorax curvispinosus TaxID=300111 RepID=A0A6J1QRV9_9HYME|nr:uncharacterized protein LOC112462831 [Temnothorax curvispinosus]
MLTLHSFHSRTDVIIQAHILQTLTNILPSFNAAPQEWPHLTKLTLADPDFLTPRPVDIIIGADSYGQIIKPNIIKRDTLMPIAQLSSDSSFSDLLIHHHRQLPPCIMPPFRREKMLLTTCWRNLDTRRRACEQQS